MTHFPDSINHSLSRQFLLAIALASAVSGVIALIGAAAASVAIHGVDIAIDDKITPQTFQDFSHSVDQLTSRGIEPQRVILNSSGGESDAAMMIGKLIRKHRMTTEAGSQCTSGCFVIWAAGIERRIQHPNTFIGMHRPYYKTKGMPEFIPDTDPWIGRLHVYFQQMNVPERIFAASMVKAPHEVYLLTDRDREEMRTSTIIRLEKIIPIPRPKPIEILIAYSARLLKSNLISGEKP